MSHNARFQPPKQSGKRIEIHKPNPCKRSQERGLRFPYRWYGTSPLKRGRAHTRGWVNQMMLPCDKVGYARDRLKLGGPTFHTNLYTAPPTSFLKCEFLAPTHVKPSHACFHQPSFHALNTLRAFTCPPTRVYSHTYVFILSHPPTFSSPQAYLPPNTRAYPLNRACHPACVLTSLHGSLPPTCMCTKDT